MSVTVKYSGPSPEVEIPALRLTCKHGDSIEVDADIAAGLVATGDWEPTKPAPAPKSATKES